MTTRLPGIYFDTVVPPVTNTLPRMDIAGFVGFASSGPLDTPVPIEDPARFLEIFGQDQVLAWDPVAGETAYAQLAPTVRAFLRNGGQRCWVVRVADNSAALANQFLLSGTLAASPDIAPAAAWLQARSEGSWSDDLILNATLSFGPIQADQPQFTPEMISIVLYPNAVTSVSPGDLLQISFDVQQGGPSSGNTPILFLPVTDVSSGDETASGGGLQQTIVVSGEHGYWFQPADFADFLQLQTAAPSSQAGSTTTWLQLPQAVSWLTQPQNTDLWIASWGVEQSADAPTFVLDGLRSQAENITSGSWLQVVFSQPTGPHGSTQLLLLVDSVRGSKAAGPASSGSPAGRQQETVQIVPQLGWWVVDDQAGRSLGLSAPRVDVLTLELWVGDASGTITTLSNLGLTPQHPRYIGFLPTDVQLFASSDQSSAPAWTALASDVSHPRFALAAPDSDDAADLPIYLPLGVPGLVDPEYYQPAITQSGSALQRDGLVLPDGQLSSSLFLDPFLIDSTVSTLLTEAFHKQYQLQPVGDTGTPGEPLVKMHALLPIDEISMIAVPDAMHLGWQPAPAQPGQDLSAPTLFDVAAASVPGQIAASWTPVAGATSYTLEQSSDPQFASSGTVVFMGAGAPDPSSPALIQSAPFAEASGCPAPEYFRVCAYSKAIAGPWSNTVSRILPAESFTACRQTALAAPVLAVPTESRGRVVLQWSVPQSDVDTFQLQVAYEPAFLLPEVLFEGQDSYFEVWSDPTRTAYFRVCSLRQSVASPWSNTAVAAADDQDALYWMNPPPAPGTGTPSFDELLQVHQAMIRLGAARGDVFALLSLPRSYDAATCVLYESLLTQSLAGENANTTLSYAAIFFPWLVTRDLSAEQPGAIRSVSPEGAIAGVMAATTLSSGAWYSPANQKFAAVVDLDANLGDQAATTFFSNQLNLLVQQPAGYMAMSSFTLSPWYQLTEMNVRRLLILLRRLALREGVDYVFQPNDTTFWRRVQTRFNELLSRLYVQGAFAGATQDQSFVVTTDSSVNTPQTIDQGQFIVSIQVAPSVPLEFLTVRLVQQGESQSVSEAF